VEKKQTENGKDYGLFVKEDCKEGNLNIECMGKVLQKKNKNNNNIYYMKINQAQLWINATHRGVMARFINHSCNPNCKLKQWEVDGLPRMSFFAIKEIKKGDKVTFDYNSECDDDQHMTECKCMAVNCKGIIERV